MDQSLPPVVDLQEAVREVIGRRRREYVRWLTEVVATPSVNPRYPGGTGEGAVQARLAALLAAEGIVATLRPVDREAAARLAPDVPLSASYEGRPNLLAHLGPPRHLLLLTSHSDVAGVAADEGWRHDPFTPRLAGGELAGRGAVDAKGALVAMAAALATVRALEVPLQRGVLLASVVDEEAGGGGILGLLADGVRPAAAVVGEPTDLRVCPATRGHWLVRLTVPGRPAHPGLAHEGVNPVDPAYRLVQAVRAAATLLDRTRPHPLWAHQPVQHVCNLATFEAGRWGQSAAVPAEARLEVMVGTVGAESLDEVRAVVDRVLEEAARGDPWLAAHPPRVEWTARRHRGAETPPDAPVVTLLRWAVARATGRPARVEGLSAVTDMRHLVWSGGVPTVNVGPGDMRVAHTAAETLPLQAFLAAVEVYALAILGWGGGLPVGSGEEGVM
ncbi:MAG: M20/M25/M40 family metallo-hydrolase [Armatimonadota bacterium]|nr:M20/M25/M40 family metallo-hydrolase [Armatimonadota bacterium]MDR7489169.1 M20/M25/M40 family metallo-hydrolase [Armatimonadota bacterium]MDR7491010.1 M20/M25/M40 family metallo-hydrolase [Armatimonadota bacterium]MDR7502462.1 M20/M25/M40 family metallo-hydrolase [Armatimonadota bacterium]MDR7528507.1 M20/M25/M40 family metallo-hydrolase [Armatimonadota bacterium]